MKAAAASLLLPMLLAACATVPRQPQAVAVEHLPLLDPATLGSDHAAQQILRAAFADHEATLRSVVIAHAGSLKMIMLTATGQRALSLEWDGTDWKVEKAPMVPEQLDPQVLVADVEFALWPMTALREPYEAAGWDLSEPGGGMRRVRRDGKLFAEVHYADADPWNGRFWLVNFRYGYSLEIEAQSMPG